MKVRFQADADLNHLIVKATPVSRREVDTWLISCLYTDFRGRSMTMTHRE